MSTVQNGNRHTPDDFWDIESLIPNSKRAAPASPSRPTSHTETTEIEFSVPVTSGAGEVPGDIGIKVSTAAASIPVKPSPTEPELVYTPLHPLIKEVRIYPWRNSFRFYERFCEMAAHYFDYKAGECDPVPFFSFFPKKYPTLCFFTKLSFLKFVRRCQTRMIFTNIVRGFLIH